MKSLFVTVFCCCVLIVQAQPTNTKSFVKQYAKKEGFTVVSINKAAMKILSVMSKFSARDDDTAMLSQVDGIYILTLDAGKKDAVEVLETDFAAFCTANRYEKMIEVEESSELVNIYGKLEGEDVTGLIIWNTSLKDSSVNLVCLNGKFTSGDVEKIISNRGKSIAGL